MKTKIAYLMEFPTISGGENSLLGLLKHIDRDEFEPVCLLPGEGSLIEVIDKLGIRTIPYRIERDRFGPTKRVEHIACEIGGLLEKEKPDLVHANSVSMAKYTGIITSRLGIPSIGHLRDIIKPTPAQLRRISENDILIAVSQAVSNWFQGLGINGDKIRVIHNGIDAERVDPEKIGGGALRKEFGLKEEDITVACIGQICLRKGQHIFLEAAEIFLRKNPGAYFFIIGKRFSEKTESIDYENALRYFVKARGLEKRVLFLGYRHDIPSLLKDMDIVVSVSHEEPLSRVLLEAGAMRIPCVATRVGGSGEIIEDKKTGFLIAPDSPAELAEKMEVLSNDPHIRKNLGENARGRIKKYFSAGRMVEETVSLYRHALGIKKAEPAENIA